MSLYTVKFNSHTGPENTCRKTYTHRSRNNTWYRLNKFLTRASSIKHGRSQIVRWWKWCYIKVFLMTERGRWIMLKEEMPFEESEWGPEKALKTFGGEEMVKYSRLTEAKELCCSYGDVWRCGPGAISKSCVTQIREFISSVKKRVWTTVKIASSSLHSSPPCYPLHSQYKLYSQLVYVKWALHYC